MAKASKPSLRRDHGAPQASTNANEEGQGLLSGNASDEDDFVVRNGDINTLTITRTPNRVRFDLPPQEHNSHFDDLPPPYDESNVHHVSGQDIPLSGQRLLSEGESTHPGTATMWTCMVTPCAISTAPDLPSAVPCLT